MELSPQEQEALTYAQYFQWPETNEWEEERNVLLNDFKTYANDLEEGMLPTEETPVPQRKIPTLTSNDKMISPR